MYQTTSCLLVHGPGSEPMARSMAEAHGKLVPFDSGVMKKEGARELVELLSSLPVGSGTRSVVVGPMDELAPATSDVLLKTIEEFDPRGVRPFLWAWDLGGVSPTIRSRCLTLFAPGEDARLEDYRGKGEKLFRCFKLKDWVGLVEVLVGSKDDDGSKTGGAKGEEVHLLSVVTTLLSQELADPEPDPRYEALWANLRPLFHGAPLTPARVVSAFLEAGA